MLKISDTKTALEIFENACIKQAEATEQGDYKSANKNYNLIVKSATYLKDENAINSLKDFLSNLNVGVRLWSACYWLPINEQEGIDVLNEIVKEPGIHSLTAEMTITGWKKGSLKF